MQTEPTKIEQLLATAEEYTTRILMTTMEMHQQ